jgi:hypothetical protein
MGYESLLFQKMPAPSVILSPTHATLTSLVLQEETKRTEIARLKNRIIFMLIFLTIYQSKYTNEKLIKKTP